ncbi:LysR family transcriptional regulator [Nocardia huaxiensis]|uniref:LysR family transcriptional regulator n=1 Tax=Nocardia huaxiensis TaxID=2755382 RepID=UPI001E545540|nr:LysR family transcriptional regulator [Nocardia huaxiensis]UFS93760.1 LysR family transcriptional regulator [Nocardia huaxiensis]
MVSAGDVPAHAGRWPYQPSARDVLPELNVRLLESFLMVASEGNITRAAARLHLTQQTLSSQIRQLERALGATLLVRGPRGVRLTEAGQALAEGSAALVDGWIALAERVNSAAGQSSKRLRVLGYPCQTAPFLIRMADALEAAVPELRLDLVSVRTIPEGVRALESGRADAGFGWLPLDGTRLRHSVIESEAWVATVSRDHRFADHDVLVLAELAEDPMVLPAIFVSEAVERDWVAALRPGRSMRDPVVLNWEHGPIIAARRQGIWLAPESMAQRHADSGSRLLPLADAPRIDAVVMWNEQAPEGLVQELISAVRGVTA